MSIQPFIKCSDIKNALDFYTEILDFKILQAPDPDPEAFMSKYALLERDGDRVHLSQHAGDGAYGNVIYVQVINLDAIYQTFTSNGLIELDSTSDNKSGITIQPVEQTWGMKEFSVSDPDGNKITFGQNI